MRAAFRPPSEEKVVVVVRMAAPEGISYRKPKFCYSEEIPMSLRTCAPRGGPVAILILVCSLALALPAQTWNASADYSSAQNPNGAWTYGLFYAGSFTPYTTVGNFCGPLAGWQSGSVPTVAKNTAVTTACCNTVRVPPGRLVMHPGPAGEMSVLRWTAPASATYAVQVLMAGLDFSYPTSTNVQVVLNGQSLFSGSVNSFNGPTSCLDTSLAFSGSYTTTLAMSAGDTLDIRVGYGSGGYFGDSTLIEATISSQGTTTAIGTAYGAFGGDLSTSAVLIGQPMTMSITNAAPNIGGTIFITTVPAGSVSFGGCVAYVSVLYLVPLFSIQTNGSGSWSGSFIVPNDPNLVGQQFVLQALLAPTATLLGFDLTNGALVTVGG